MQAWQVDVTCPLCGGKFRLNRINRHKNRKHPDLSVNYIKKAIKDAHDNGQGVLDGRRIVNGGKIWSAGNATRERGKTSLGVTSMVRGGAVGLGKKR